MKAAKQREAHADPPADLRELRTVFHDVHQHGKKALEAGDYKTFGEAVAVERSLILEQRRLMELLLAKIHQGD